MVGLRFFLGLALAAGLGAPALAAPDEVSGEVEYRINCASCHGLDGKGEGPMTPALSTTPPDLTELAARNDGAFPFLHVVEVIDGRIAVTGHGSRDMPVWGARFRENFDGAVARARILELALYLRGIQEQ